MKCEVYDCQDSENGHAVEAKIWHPVDNKFITKKYTLCTEHIQVFKDSCNPYSIFTKD